jgi:hypothetical protein
MANTTGQDIIDSFESTMREKVALSPSLEYQWVRGAVGEYNLNIGTLNYNASTFEFDVELDHTTVMILGYLVKLRYLEREMSRVNKINNIITKDLSLNGRGDTKRMTMEELRFEFDRTKEMLNMLNTPSYAN